MLNVSSYKAVTPILREKNTCITVYEVVQFDETFNAAQLQLPYVEEFEKNILLINEPHRTFSEATFIEYDGSKKRVYQVQQPVDVCTFSEAGIMAFYDMRNHHYSYFKQLGDMHLVEKISNWTFSEEVPVQEVGTTKGISKIKTDIFLGFYTNHQFRLLNPQFIDAIQKTYPYNNGLQVVLTGDD